MADIRINALATTAASTASDDYIAIDGSANGTRKLNAYSPTFGGDLTVSGTGSISRGFATGAANTNGDISLTINGNASIGTAARWINQASSAANNWQIGTNLTGNWLSFMPSTAADGTTFSTDAFKLTPAGNATLAGNLTVSGTGTFTGAGAAWTSNATSGNSLNIIQRAADTALACIQLKTGSTADWVFGSRELGDSDFHLFSYGTVSTVLKVVRSNGNLLLGTTTDSSNGKLQLATHTTSAGGIGFGADSSLFSASATVLRFNGQNSDTQIQIAKNGTTGFGILVDGASTYITASGSSGVMYLRTNGGTTALTLDSSQNATFAGNVKANGGYFQGPSGANLGIVAASGRSLDLYSDGGILGLTIVSGTGNATFAGSIAIGNTVQTAASVASTHKVTISIGGSTYYLLATNV